jgi:hypothetical protein
MVAPINPPFLGNSGTQDIAGRRWRLANSAISCWRGLGEGIGCQSGARPKLSKTRSISDVVRTGTATDCTRSDDAAAFCVIWLAHANNRSR